MLAANISDYISDPHRLLHRRSRRRDPAAPAGGPGHPAPQPGRRRERRARPGRRRRRDPQAAPRAPPPRAARSARRDAERAARRGRETQVGNAAPNAPNGRARRPPPAPASVTAAAAATPPSAASTSPGFSGGATPPSPPGAGATPPSSSGGPRSARPPRSPVGLPQREQWRQRRRRGPTSQSRSPSSGSSTGRQVAREQAAPSSASPPLAPRRTRLQRGKATAEARHRRHPPRPRRPKRRPANHRSPRTAWRGADRRRGHCPRRERGARPGAPEEEVPVPPFAQVPGPTEPHPSGPGPLGPDRRGRVPLAARVELPETPNWPSPRRSAAAADAPAAELRRPVAIPDRCRCGRRRTAGA